MVVTKPKKYSGMFQIEAKIEIAKVSDCNEIGALSKKYVEYNLGWRYNSRKLQEVIKDKTKNIVVARKGNKLAGFGVMSYKEESANLDLLAVKIRYRRCGIGRQVVEWLEKVAYTAGIENIYVQVRKLNLGAIKFYKKLGFQVIDEKSSYYSGKETGIIMYKNIM